jgi:anti-sigma-K factor RskA
MRAADADGVALAAANVVAFRGQVRRWRNVAAFTSAIAAALVAMVATQAYRPDLLPEGLRPKPQIQVVQAPAPVPAQYVAVLQKDGNSPAFILTVDNATKNFTVRKVDAQPEPGKSYELWIVSDKLQQPRSLGVIGGDEFTARPVLSSYDADTINQATYAVTVEPGGGSPTGVPTGPIVFTGKLVESVPAAQPSPKK